MLIAKKEGEKGEKEEEEKEKKRHISIQSAIKTYLIYLISFESDHSVQYTIKYTTRHDTIVSLHSNQPNIVKCSQKYLIML